jgi:hypothetical protein
VSVIDLVEQRARLEIVGDEPAPGVEFEPSIDGITIMRDGTELYEYVADEKLLRPITLRLPECQLLPAAVRIGSNTLSGNVVSGPGVGIVVDEDSFSMGAPVPPGLAKLAV